MRLAAVVKMKGNGISIPAPFARSLGLYDGSRFYVSQVRGDDNHHILTTLPPDCWGGILRVTVLLPHQPGALHRVADALSRPAIAGNTLIMEGYGREPDKEGWWGGIVHLDPPDGDEEAGDSKRVSVLEQRKKVLSELAKLYSSREEGGMLPLPEHLSNKRASGCGVEIVEDGLVIDREKFLRVEAIRLTDLQGRVGEPRVFVYHERSGRGSVVKVGRNPIRNRDASRGFLMCNTDERFLRFVEIECPVEIELAIRARSKRGVAATGVLSALTEVLMNEDTGEDPNGINIIFLYNYITGYTKEPVGDPEVMESVEHSVVKFYLQTPRGWINNRSSFLREWARVFENLLRVTIDGVSIVEPSKSEMKVWHKRICRFGSDEKRGARRRYFSMFEPRSGFSRVRDRFLSRSLMLVVIGTFVLSFVLALVALASDADQGLWSRNFLLTMAGFVIGVTGVSLVFWMRLRDR